MTAAVCYDSEPGALRQHDPGSYRTLPTFPDGGYFANAIG